MAIETRLAFSEPGRWCFVSYLSTSADAVSCGTMAQRRRTATRSGGEIVVVNAAPVQRRSSGAIRRRSSGGGKRRRRSKGGGGGSAGIDKRMQGVAIGGLAFGLLVKNFPNMPKVPGIGRSGTIALAVYFLKPKNRILQDMGIAAAAIAGYSFGETGSVAGDDDGILASQG